MLVPPLRPLKRGQPPPYLHACFLSRRAPSLVPDGAECCSPVQPPTPALQKLPPIRRRGGRRLDPSTPRAQMSLAPRSSSSTTQHREAPPPSTPRYMGVDYYSASTVPTTKTSRRPTESSPYDATPTRTQPTRRQKPSSRISLLHMRLPAPPSHSLCLSMIIMFDLAILGCRSILCHYPYGS